VAYLAAGQRHQLLGNPFQRHYLFGRADLATLAGMPWATLVASSWTGLDRPPSSGRE